MYMNTMQEFKVKNVFSCLTCTCMYNFSEIISDHCLSHWCLRDFCQMHCSGKYPYSTERIEFALGLGSIRLKKLKNCIKLK